MTTKIQTGIKQANSHPDHNDS